MTGYVYLMRRADGAWKIGFSANPHARVAGLQAQFKMPVRFVRQWKHANARKVESMVHRLLAGRRDTLGGGRESYRATRRLMVETIKQAVACGGVPARSIRPKAQRPPMADVAWKPVMTLPQMAEEYGATDEMCAAYTKRLVELGFRA